MLRVVIAACILGLSLQASATPFKAQLVNSKGDVLGTRQITDLNLCGTSVGYQQIAEDVSLKSERMYIECRSSFEPMSTLEEQSWPGAEVRTLVSQGPTENRIDLTIVSDGYTEQEKSKFFEDAAKITEDLFGQNTFKTYLALFNVHAVFVPSKESGIGDGSPKNTALKLYRHPTTRQAVIPGDESAARKAAALAPDVDYPILLGNDKFYGGLGGEFAVTTASPLNLTTVLRHELGHNFGQVGEEYDGGNVYDGANFSDSTDVPWSYFAPSVPIFKAKLIFYEAPWKNLSTGAWEKKFNFPAGYAWFYIYFSSLGFETPQDARLLIDGRETPFTGEYNYDRNFYSLKIRLPAGSHVIRLEELVHDGDNIFSKMGAYAEVEDFPNGSDVIGAFATYNGYGSMVGYRPTESFCLMRNMTSHQFCGICLENMWHQFLTQIKLIDTVFVGDGKAKVALVPLGPERLKLEWFDPSGRHRSELDGLTEIPVDLKGIWTIRAEFVSSEIKVLSHPWTVQEQKFQVR